MSFAYKATLTVTGSSTLLPSTQTDFPVLVALTDVKLKTVANGGFVQNASGYDIRFFSDAGLTTAIPFELESYDGSAGTIVMWVKIASLALSGVFYAGFGDASLNTNASSTSTWASQYKLVWHFPDGTTLTANDSTSNANHGTLNNSPTAAAGKIGGGMTVNGSTQDVTKAHNSGLAVNAGDFTVSVIAKTTANPSFAAVFEKTTDAAQRDYSLFMNAGKIGFCVISNNGGGVTGATAILNDGAWKSIKVSRAGSAVKVYVNGVVDCTATNSSTTNSSGNISVGKNPSGGGNPWNGSYDEFRVASVAESADWITAEYYQTPGSGFLSAVFESNASLPMSAWYVETLRPAVAPKARFALPSYVHVPAPVLNSAAWITQVARPAKSAHIGIVPSDEPIVALYDDSAAWISQERYIPVRRSRPSYFIPRTVDWSFWITGAVNRLPDLLKTSTAARTLPHTTQPRTLPHTTRKK